MVWAGDGRLSPNGDLELSIHARLVPTQDDIDVIKEQLTQTQMLLCDATDGLIKLRRVAITRRASDEKRADGWWYPIDGRENSSLVGLGDPTKRFLLFGNATSANPLALQDYIRMAEVRPARYGALSFSTAATIAHELGHYILGVGDEYPELNRWNTGCSFGPGFDTNGLFDDGVTASRRDSTWNTLLQTPAMVCVNAGGQTHNDLDPFLGPVPCANDATCSPYGPPGSWTCQPDPFGSELAVAANFDGRRAPWTQGAAPASCPAPRPGSRMFLTAKVIRNVNGISGVLQLADFDPEDQLTYNAGITLRAMDDVGDIKDSAPSLHAVHSVLVKYDEDKVMLILLADESEYDSPPPSVGEYKPWRDVKRAVFEIGRFALGFHSDGSLSTVNGLAVDAEGRDVATGTLPRLLLGGGIPPTFGGTVDGAAGQTVSTGGFRSIGGSTPSAISLDLLLGGVEINNYESQTAGTPGNSAFFCSDPLQCGSLRRGITASRIEASGGLPQVGRCDDVDWCAAVYQPATGAFEGTDHTWRSLRTQADAAGQSVVDFINGKLAAGSIPEVRSDWQTFFDLYGDHPENQTGIVLTDLIAPKTSVEPAPPTLAQCGGPVEIDVDDLQIPERFFIVLDRSGSMKENAGVTTATRMDFAKAAAEAVVSSFSGSGTEIGVVTFADEATLDQPLTTNYTPVRDAIEAATPGGMTAIGSGLKLAVEQLRALPNPSGNGILLLTDGENNRPCECARDEWRYGCPGDVVGPCTADPIEVARDLERDIILYTVPVGSAADRGGLSEMAASTGGEMLDTSANDQVIPAFIEAYAAFQGHTPLLGRTESFVQAPPIVVRQTSAPSVNEFDMPVEFGAERLDIVLSVHDSDPDLWNPRFSVLRPDGTVYLDSTDANPPMVSHPYFRIVRITSPAPGTWQLRVRAPSSGSTRSYVMAHVHNPAPDCFVGATPKLADGTRSVEISATASHVLPLESGVSFSGTVLRPDGNDVALSFQPEGPGSDRHVATFDPSHFVGRGVYQVRVECSVSSGARAVRGEGHDRFKPPNSVDVEPFTRVVRGYFFLDVPQLPPLPPGNDCDGDGILNDDEAGGDTDGDGLPDICDEDADGDDVWDGIDPDPTDPTIPGTGCAAIPADVGCCTRLATCGGARNFALYAEGTLDIHDNARVRTQGGSPGAVINAGTGSTTVGADAAIGNLHSQSSVFLRERARVDGAVTSAGNVTQQNGVIVTGGINEQASLSTPSLSTFDVPFPSTNSGDFSLDPGQRDTLLPGSHARVSVKANSTLDLRSGTYYLQELAAEAGSTIQIDASDGAVYLYVQQQLHLKGTLTIPTASSLFVGFFGTGTAFLENDFHGTVVAPNGSLVLSAGGPDRYQGGFFAKHLLVGRDVQVRAVPFVRPWTGGAGAVLASGSEPSPAPRPARRGCAWAFAPQASGAGASIAVLGLVGWARRRYKKREGLGTRSRS